MAIATENYRPASIIETWLSGVTPPVRVPEVITPGNNRQRRRWFNVFPRSSTGKAPASQSEVGVMPLNEKVNPTEPIMLYTHALPYLYTHSDLQVKK
ncbi:MAG: hypothetical protein ACR2LN_05830 [Candidatus Levyibacteriota bacterium]